MSQVLSNSVAKALVISVGPKHRKRLALWRCATNFLIVWTVWVCQLESGRSATDWKLKVYSLWFFCVFAPMQLSCDNVHIRNYMYAVANWGFSTITWKSRRPVSVKDQVSQKLKRAWCYSVVKQDWVWKLQVGWLQMTTNITQNFNVKILPLFLVWNWVLVVSKVVLILSFPCSALLCGTGQVCIHGTRGVPLSQ